MTDAKKRVMAAIGCGIGCGALAFGGIFLFASRYHNRVLPGVFVGDVPLGGMSRGALVKELQHKAGVVEEAGIDVTFTAKSHVGSFTIHPTVVTEDTTQELISLDIERAADSILAYGKSDAFFIRIGMPLWSAVARPHIAVQDIVVDKEKLQAVMSERLDAYERIPKDARVVISNVDPLQYTISDATTGIVYDYDRAIADVVSYWGSLRIAHIRLDPAIVTPTIERADINGIIQRLPSIFARGGLAISYRNPETHADREWIISTRQIADWIVPIRLPEGDVTFGMDRGLLLAYIRGSILSVVDREPQDAKFRVDESGKAVEFQGSRSGVSVDLEETGRALQNVIIERVRHDNDVPRGIALAVSNVQPHVTTGQANDFGIAEILGIGASNFSGSPTNRIKNIRHAVQKLDGVLIQPDEEFSTLLHAGPFTEDAGYLPELVIKGDTLIPEVGGGLCQIGTTLFRMAMNSGMPITARRNHSLVVSYYGDPRNGNPGTDATIYEPAPDFRFKNDTGHHLLIQTDMNEASGDLVFTMWGTSDGRSASYTEPIVSAWIPYGETKIVETTKLPVGEKKCQKAFRGAHASFVYTRQFADGTAESRAFDSIYRPLPEICLLGVIEKTTSSTLENIDGVPAD